MFDSINSTKFGQYLKTLRIKLNLTQASISDSTGINADTIRRIEIGQVIPKYETLSILSQVYKVDLVKKFTEYRTETTILSLYSSIDECLLNYDIDGIKEIRDYLLTDDISKLISSNLINRNELLQFKCYIDIKLLHLLNLPITTENSVDKLKEALQLTIPDFSISSYDKHTYNAFELRILISYALMWAALERFELSNQILLFTINRLMFLFPNDALTSRYLLKIHFNISYHYHRLDLYEESLTHAELGINIGKSKHCFDELHTLYYRKFTAELRLNKPCYLHSLRKCILIMQLLGVEKLMDIYISVTKEKYDIDILTDPFFHDLFTC